MNETMNTGALTLDDATCTAAVNGQALKLTVQEFRVLKALTTKPGIAVAYPELDLALYGAEARAAESNVVEVLVCRIRRKLKDVGLEGVLVTQRRLGYSYIGQVA